MSVNQRPARQRRREDHQRRQHDHEHPAPSLADRAYERHHPAATASRATITGADDVHRLAPSGAWAASGTMVALLLPAVGLDTERQREEPTLRGGTWNPQEAPGWGISVSRSGEFYVSWVTRGLEG
jgi:hypothetical protein